MKAKQEDEEEGRREREVSWLQHTPHSAAPADLRCRPGLVPVLLPVLLRPVQAALSGPQGPRGHGSMALLAGEGGKPPRAGGAGRACPLCLRRRIQPSTCSLARDQRTPLVPALSVVSLHPVFPHA